MDSLNRQSSVRPKAYGGSPPTSKAVSRKPRMLAVDDEPEVLNLFREIVEPLGYEIQVSSDSRAASQKLEEEKFDCVVLDALMPSPDGFELTERMRASRMNQAVPVVMITGYDSVDTRRRGFAAGITFFIGKPLTPEKLRGLFKVVRGSILREMRRYGRLPLDCRVDCWMAGRHFKARSVDIAEGGILLQGPTDVPVGEVLELTFSFPMPSEKLNLMGKVVRVDAPNRLAVEFIEIEPQQLAATQTYIYASTGE